MRLRSLLFVPGDRPDQMRKAQQTAADAVILDLEDSVAGGAKEPARRHVADFLDVTPRVQPVFVRLNSLATGLTERDIAGVAAASASPDGWVLPKAEGAASITALGRLLAAAGVPNPRILPIATETPVAVFHLGEYASVATRLAGVTWGVEDLPAAIGATTAREPDGRLTPPYEMVRALVLFAAHAAGVPAIETVYPAFRDNEGLTRTAALAARDGFNGMMAIHPAQVPIINAAFTPSPAAVAHAERVVAAFANQPGAGVLSLDGAMIDAPHLRQAQRILAQAGGLPGPRARGP
jgi:citrate lyase subunit beta/citryl-CoA lyase